MASVYVPVRIATLILSLLTFISGIVGLVKELQGYAADITGVVAMAIVVVVIFLGLYGSFKHDRTYLMTFALILIISIIVGFVSKAPVYGPLYPSIILAILALTQAELIKRGYH